MTAMLSPRVLSSFGLAVVSGALLSRSAEVPAPPAAQWPVFPECQFASAEQVSRVFLPMKGSQPAALAGQGEQTWVRLPGNFRDTTHDRCSWDIALKADLSLARGVQLLFYSADSNPVSHYSAYFHSGDGWYVTSFGLSRDGAWERVLLDKSRTGSEGKPGGWGTVDLIRISAWRARSDTDTQFGIAQVGPIGSNAAIVVLRADSAAATPEARAVAQFAESVGRCLDDLGLDYALLADLDLTRERLQGRKLVILPHNPTVPDEAVALLREFVASGGRLLSFYGLPGPLLEAVGMRAGQWVRPAEGPYLGMKRMGDGIPGQPEFVGQASWNIHPMYPAEGKGSILAVWRSAEGQDTDLPAVTLTDRGVHIAHVLLADDWPGKKQLMLALIGQCLPDAWQQAARRELGRAGVFGSFAGLDDLGAALGRDGLAGKAKEVWGQALAAQDRATKAIASGAYPQAITDAQEARRAAMVAWCLTRKAVPGEHRAFWCHSAFGLDGMSWDAAIQFLAEAGFTAILPNLLWGGTAFYPSEVLPVYADLATRGDQMQLCLEACRKHKVQCHVWKVNWNLGGHAPADFVQRLAAAGRLQRAADGTADDPWLCPSHPENQALEVDSLVEVARRYPVDGLHFDYIRYPDGNHCFCAGCRERFGQHLGQPVADWPAAVRSDGPLRTKWLDWRRDQITTVVRSVAEQARTVRPGIRISAAVFSNWPVDRDQVGQDWKLWCEKGYLDFVCPMDYTDSNQSFHTQVRNQTEWCAGKPLYPGIGLSCWADPCDPVRLIEQIAICRELGTGGFTVFNYDRNAREVLPYLRLGATAQ
jgi:uncharacterized lipoprotein YddW (UPF0748 family)